MPSFRFLLHVSYAYGIPVCLPIEEELIKRGYEVKWFAEEEDAAQLLSLKNNLLSRAQEVMQYQPDFVLCASNTVPYFFPGIKVQLFHGFSVNKRSEKKGHFRLRGLFDLYCTQGPSTTVHFKELARKHQYFAVMETGWPKVDPLFPVVDTTNPKPVVFLASTFTQSLSLAHDAELFAELQRLILTDKYHWIINLHPKMDASIVRKFKGLKGDFEYLDYLTDLKWLQKADVMVCDTSSITTEFILQNKPVVTYKNRKPGPHLVNITNPDDLETALQKALSRPAELIEAIQDFIHITHPYTDGKSSARVVEACLYFKEHQQELVSGKKPLNLIRKWQSHRKFKYYGF